MNSPYSYPGTLSDAQLNNTVAQSIVIESVCAYFKISRADLRAKGRQPDMVRRKQIAVYLFRIYTDLAHREIAPLVGLADHSATVHHVKVATNMIATEPDYRADIENISEIIKTRLGK